MLGESIPVFLSCLSSPKIEKETPKRKKKTIGKTVGIRNSKSHYHTNMYGAFQTIPDMC